MIIITGASNGIGKYLFDFYSNQNKERVVGTYFSTTPLYQNNYYKVDVSNYGSVESFFDLVEPILDEKITLINCAGISYNSYAHKSDPELWRKVIEVNLIGTYNVVRVFLQTMRQNNFGRIINFSSIVAQKNTPGVSAYAASKSALWGFTKSLCVENGALNITINSINLGYANIGMGVESVPPEFQEVIKSQIPSKQFCPPENIFNTIEYFRETQYINGTSIDLNGGLF